MNEDKATRYHRMRRRVAVAGLAASAGVLLGIVASGADAAIADASRTLTRSWPAPDVAATVLFTAWVAALVLAARFPFDRFRESTLERRYGLGRAPVQAWAWSFVRESAVTLVTLGLVAVGLRTCGAIAGPLWWIPAALSWWTGQVMWTVAAPMVLSVFGGLRPLRRPGLAERLRVLGRKAGATIDVLEWRGGDDSRRAHAALAGIGRTRRVILSDTLLDTLTEPEIEVVVAHELAHHVHADVWRAAAWRLLAMPATAATAAAAASWRFPAGAGVPIEALPMVALAGGAAHLLLQPMSLALSRRCELAADAYALRVTGNADAFVSSMRRLSANNLIDDRPPALARLFASHPTVRERLLAVLRQGG